MTNPSQVEGLIYEAVEKRVLGMKLLSNLGDASPETLDFLRDTLKRDAVPVDGSDAGCTKP